MSEAPKYNLHERGRVSFFLLGNAITKLGVVEEYARLSHDKYNEANGMDGIALLLDTLVGELSQIEDNLRPFTEARHDN